MSYKVRFFELASGRCPFKDWMDGLDKSTAARIDARILRFESGLIGDAKRLKGSEIFEARLDFGPGYRLYFGVMKKELILLLLHGGDKKSQKADIARAEQYWKKHLEAQNGKNS